MEFFLRVIPTESASLTRALTNGKQTLITGDADLEQVNTTPVVKGRSEVSFASKHFVHGYQRSRNSSNFGANLSTATCKLPSLHSQ